jgi:integrase
MEILLFHQSILSVSQKDKPHLPVSKKSKYEDMLWDYSEEIPQHSLKYNQKCINWDFKLDNGKRSTAPEYSSLLGSTKNFIYSLMSDPVDGRRPQYSTLIDRFKNCRSLLKWMIANGYERFSQLDKNSLEQYEQYHKTRKAMNCGDKDGRLKPTALSHLFDIVRALYKQRDKIEDAITVEPFDGETGNERAGTTRAVRAQNKTERIPDEVAVDLLSKAFNYVEVKSEAILKAMDAVEAFRKEPTEEDNHTKIAIAEEHGVADLRDLNAEKKRLRTACYIIIAYFSGIRVSEGLSIKKGCIEKKRSDNGTDYYLLHSTHYKTEKRPKADTWLVPEAVAIAVDVLERLSEPWRKQSELDYLLLNMNKSKSGKRGVISDMNKLLKEFTKDTGVVFHNGKPWNLTTHQFRKTFAYFMARENKCNFKFLQEQFKHVSMDMTLWYVITEEEDMELLEDVENAVEDVSLECLYDIMTPGKNIGGAGGAYIAERRDKIFKGMAGEDIHRTLNESGMDDLYVRSTIYGLCVFNEEHAECNAGFDCLCNPNTCKNAVVTDDYKKHWVELLQRCGELINRPSASPLQKAYTQRQLDEFILPMFWQMKWSLEGLLGNGKEVA